MPAASDIVYFRDGDRVPAADFLDACPVSVEAKMVAVLDAVAAAPPPSSRAAVSGRVIAQPPEGIRAERANFHHFSRAVW
ncbi:MAG: hypothetical protein ACREJ4_07560 [Candidatus Methylomirabilaceae bacterium]